MGLAYRLQLGFNLAQLSQLAIQRHAGALGFGLHLGLFCAGLATAQKPQLLLLERGLCTDRLVALRHLRLPVELFQVGIEFAQDVFHPGQVLPGVRQPVLGLAAAFLVFGNSGGLFEEQTQFLRAALDDAADRALANNGIGPRPQPGTQKNILHITPTHRLAVDKVAAVAVAGKHPLDGDLGKLAPLATSPVVGVVKHQLHAGPTGRLAQVCAVKDDILHRLATQLGGARLAQYPTHSIDDVGFATAVGPHHAHELPGQHEIGRFNEGLEAR